MEELELQDRPGIMSKVMSIFTRADDEDEEEETTAARPYRVHQSYKYTVAVRRQIASFDDAIASAQGLKRGEQQVLNLSGTEPTLRQKIVDFMSGVNFSEDGTWEEIGEHIYLVVPSSVQVTVEPASPRAAAMRN